MNESTLNVNGAQKTIQEFLNEKTAMLRTHERVIKCFMKHSGRMYLTCQDCGWQSHQETRECNALIKSKKELS